MADYPERQEAPNDAENEDRRKSLNNAVFAWPGGRCNWSYSVIVPGKHEQTFQEAENRVHRPRKVITPKLNEIVLGEFRQNFDITP